MAWTGVYSQVFYRTVELCFAVMITVLNVVEIVMISTMKRQKKIYEMLLLSLSVADLLFGISNGILCVVYLLDNTKYEVFEVTYTTYFYFVLTSILHLSWIALDRLWAVCWPFQHDMHVTRRRICKLIAATWVFTTLMCVFMFLYDELTEIKDKIDTVDTNTTSANNSDTFNVYSKEPLYKSQVQMALSLFILTADIVYVIAYGIIIHNVKDSNLEGTSQPDNIKKKVSIVCITIASVFITFTLPYPSTRLIY